MELQVISNNTAHTRAHALRRTILPIHPLGSSVCKQRYMVIMFHSTGCCGFNTQYIMHCKQIIYCIHDKVRQMTRWRNISTATVRTPSLPAGQRWHPSRPVGTLGRWWLTWLPQRRGCVSRPAGLHVSVFSQRVSEWSVAPASCAGNLT